MVVDDPLGERSAARAADDEAVVARRDAIFGRYELCVRHRFPQWRDPQAITATEDMDAAQERQRDEVEIVIQVNGKVRSRELVPAGLGQKEVEAVVLANERVQQLLEGRAVKKMVVVPGKLVNIVVA